MQTLVRFRQAVQEVPRYNIQILTVDSVLIDDAASASQQSGLLTNDALVVAVMRRHVLMHLASHDADFDRVPGLTQYSAV